MRMVRFLAALALAAAPAMLRADDSSPAAQMKASLAALSQGDAKALINSLPKSYRADAQELVREAVGKIDAEVWNKGFAAAKKAIKLLKDKKALVLEATSAFVQLPPDEAGKIYDGVVGLLAPVVESDIADHSAAAKMDLDSWAADVGNKQLKALMGVETKLPPPVNMTIKEMFKVMADAKIEVI